MPNLADLMAKETLTQQERAQLRDRINVLEASLSNMKKMLNKSTTGLDADTVDGHHGTGAVGELLVLPPATETAYAYEMLHVTPDHTIDADSTTLGELADFACTIALDLIALKVFCTPK